MLERIKLEPVVIYDVLKYGLGVATAFGVALRPDQIAAILGFASVALVLLTGATRGSVTPVRKLAK